MDFQDFGWLRLKPPVECIPHPYDMYAKCLGVDFQDFGVDLSPSDDVVPWLRLKPPGECNPHPYDMYKVF